MALRTLLLPNIPAPASVRRFKLERPPAKETGEEIRYVPALGSGNEGTPQGAALVFGVIEEPHPPLWMNVPPVAPLALENVLVYVATLGFRFCCRIFTRTCQQFIDANDKTFVSSDALPVFIIHRRLKILVKEPYAIHDAPAPESGRLADGTAALKLLELKLARIVFADNIAMFIDIVSSPVE